MKIFLFLFFASYFGFFWFLQTKLHLLNDCKMVKSPSLTCEIDPYISRALSESGLNSPLMSDVSLSGRTSLYEELLLWQEHPTPRALHTK